MHRYRHRTAAWIGQQAIVDLEQPALAVAAVAELGERAAVVLTPAEN